MIIVVFRSRLRSGISEEFGELASSMSKLAATMPGFIAHDSYASKDGQRMSIVRFESAETCEAWRDHPEHVEAQRLGRDRYYAEYSIYVTECVRENHYEF